MSSPDATSVEALVAQARADMATVLVGQFQQDLNALRGAAESSKTQVAALETENTKLKAENARLRARLAQQDVDVDMLSQDDDDEGGEASPETVWLSSPMQHPPPEGTLFSNGGPYDGHNRQSPLKKELNKWTRARGYSIKVLRSKFSSRRITLTIACDREGKGRGRQQAASDPACQRTMATTAAAGAAIAGDERTEFQGTAVGAPAKGGRKRSTRARDCPLRFMLQEIEPGSGKQISGTTCILPRRTTCQSEASHGQTVAKPSAYSNESSSPVLKWLIPIAAGTFVVRPAHGGLALHQRCNHEPDPIVEADSEAEPEADNAAWEAE